MRKQTKQNKIKLSVDMLTPSKNSKKQAGLPLALFNDEENSIFNACLKKTCNIHNVPVYGDIVYMYKKISNFESS